ncbi:MAG: glutaredoxin family protein [Pseudomonadota bacterium]
MVTKVLTLYSTSACHLCELAETMLSQAGVAIGGLQIHIVDISESDDLFARYGVRIPVVADIDGREIGWPFTMEELETFLKQGQ